MRISSKLVAILAGSAFALAACEGPKVEGGNDRWATTENTNVAIDWDKVNEAYKKAEGPEDFERRVNEIYEGSEVISVAVQDLDAKTQVVTGFFDKNADGKVDDAEKVFTIQRVVTGEGEAQMQTQGYGHYAGYHSPMMGLVSGMLLGSMISNAFSPRYVPAYTQPYTTSTARRSELRSQRSNFRASNPGKYGTPRSKNTGRSYGGGRSGGGFRGGGRFGLARAGRAARPARLTA